MPNSWRGRNDAPPEVVTYRCAMCAEAFEGAVMQLYHDLDEFRAHCRSKHSELDTESLIAGYVAMIHAEVLRYTDTLILLFADFINLVP